MFSVEDATCGGHVRIPPSQEQYIIPLCDSHNGIDDQEYEVVKVTAVRAVQRS